MKCRFLFFLLWAGFTSTVFAQNPGQAVQDNVAGYLRDINGWVSSQQPGASDSLAAVNFRLMSYLKTEAIKTPDLLKADLSELKPLGMNVLTSEDKKFRIYCWDTKTGGTMHFYNALLQYEVNYAPKIYVLSDVAARNEENPDPGVLYTDLYTITSKDKKKFYLPAYAGIYSSTGRIMGIKAFTIEEFGNLNDHVKFFKSYDTFENELAVEYDFFSNYDDKSMSQKNTIRMSDDRETLYFPVATEDGKMTEKSIIYKFDGSKFVHTNYARD